MPGAHRVPWRAFFKPLDIHDIPLSVLYEAQIEWPKMQGDLDMEGN